MAERIELPPSLQGDEKAQLQQLWSYLYQMSEALNNNLDAIGGNDLTDSERQVMNRILGEANENIQNFSEMETLKSLIIKTADFVQTSLQEYRMSLLGESVASGQFGRYVRHTGLDVEVTPSGITQNYTFEEVVQGLKEFSVNAKNYIKTGLLRTVSSIPVYGVAIGKDVVTFSEDGTETYNDGNKVAELTADELSFWQSGVKIAGYTGSRISFYYNGVEAFYIQAGKIYAVNDLELASGKKVVVGNWEFSGDGMVYDDPDYNGGFEIAEYSHRDEETSGIFYRRYVTGDGTVDRQLILKVESYDGDDKYESNFIIGTEILAGGIKNKYFVPGRADGFGNFIGTEAYPFDKGYIKWLRNVDIITVDQNGTYKQIGEPSHPFDGGYIKWLRNVDIITVDQNGTYKQIGEPSHPFDNGYIKRLSNVDIITIDQNGTYKQIGEPSYPFSSGFINNVRKVDYIEVDSNGTLKRIGDSNNKFNSIYVDSIRYVDSITLDPNATYKQIGEPTYPFDTEYVNKLRKVDYIEVNQNGSYKQIGFADAPFERVYAKKLYGGIASQYTTITDYNSLTTDGRFWVNAADMTNGPSTLTAGVAEIEVVTISTSYVRQRIYSQYKIYSRERYNGTWGSWYQFTGEAV